MGKMEDISRDFEESALNCAMECDAHDAGLANGLRCLGGSAARWVGRVRQGGDLRAWRGISKSIR